MPISEPSRAADAQKFADTIIQQLHAGAPFAVVAAQFSASQTALQGGDLGWVDSSQLDPAVLKIVQEMPEGAISNPVRVPGGLTIVTLRAKREIGKDEVHHHPSASGLLPIHLEPRSGEPHGAAESGAGECEAPLRVGKDLR